MNNDQDQQNKIEKINEKLEEVASKAVGPNVSYGSTPGYVEENREDEAQAAAEQEGVKLYRNPDGSHEAVDESKIDPEADSHDSNG
ncbi:hypothetical protein [Brevibacterium aurantiacum]|uniref:Uncharacterized protein n=1 Tax=Brevibacterium aurantiacum TaxID=273384 RepID=A0A556CMA7_BREAU|nr:hypothetical protein [Brevibacterium aurantiacum]TSI18561.1 hypothetical protein FO013_03095 [Brevibacterium aurantiacum]